MFYVKNLENRARCQTATNFQLFRTSGKTEKEVYANESNCAIKKHYLDIFESSFFVLFPRV